MINLPKEIQMKKVVSISLISAVFVMGLSMVAPTSLAASDFKENYEDCMFKIKKMVAEGSQPNYCNENYCRYRSCILGHDKSKKHLCKGVFDNFKWCLKQHHKQKKF